MLHTALDCRIPFRWRHTAISVQSQCYEDRRACLKKAIGLLGIWVLEIFFQDFNTDTQIMHESVCLEQAFLWQ